MRARVVSFEGAWGTDRAKAWKDEQAADHHEWKQSPEERRFKIALINGLGTDTTGTLRIRLWLSDKMCRPNSFELDDERYGHQDYFSMTLEDQLEDLLYFLLEFRPVEGWDALTRNQRLEHLKWLQDSARAFASALAAPCTPRLPSLLHYIPDEDGERLLRGAFRSVECDIAQNFLETPIPRAERASRFLWERANMAQDGLSRAEIDAVTDEDIHVTNVEYVVQKLDCRLTETMFDSSLFSEDEGEPFAFGAKFASYLCAFADDVGDKVDLKLRSARPNTNATAKQLARELHRHLHGVYGQHKVSVMAEVMSIWFAAKDVRAKPITARRVTVLLDD